ncbi:MAG: hypothetical protein ACP5N3_00055 [Candidatus Nanoarchaeia archaeon]
MDYFIKIAEPKKLRIGLMSTARDSVIMISALESFVEIRKQKTDVILDLNNDFKELQVLCRQLSELVADEKTRKEALESYRPAVKADTSVKTNAKPLKKGAKDVFVSTVPEKTSAPDINRKTEADRLEYTLAQIEQKLASLQK